MRRFVLPRYPVRHLSTIVAGIHAPSVGCVIIAAPARVEHSTLFYRDVAAYIVITGFIITISVGHRVPMWLALSFLVLYTLYAASVIAASFMAPAPSAVTVRIATEDRLVDGHLDECIVCRR